MISELKRAANYLAASTALHLLLFVVGVNPVADSLGFAVASTFTFSDVGVSSYIQLYLFVVSVLSWVIVAVLLWIAVRVIRRLQRTRDSPFGGVDT
ncbi:MULTISPECIES: hypothetical protein [Salinibaculum]|uniref:hypothetical protein n=1 Tax=Salinibaculum TaxID=2732368 RepID=UPI0030CBC505